MKRIIVIILACLSAGMLHANHWTSVAEGTYAFSMTMYGVIQIDGVEQSSDQLEVGVFCGDECRGTTMASVFFLTQRYLAELNVFGENGHQLTFKLYDHRTNEELLPVSTETIAFTLDGYGNPIEPYVLDFTPGQPATAFHFTTAGNWNKASNWQGGALPSTNDAVFIDANCTLNMNAEVSALTITAGKTLTLQSGKTLTVAGNLTNTRTTGLVIKDGAQLINASANVVATVEKNITAHATASDGWYTIASPMYGMAVAGSGFIANEYDLYRFNETNLNEEEWENYKANNQSFATFDRGRGYLYANSSTVTPAFTGTLNASSVTFPLTCTERPDDPLSGFNLIGNPFPHVIYKGAGGAIDNANLASGYYTLDNDDTWQVHTFEDAILPGQGILVKATASTDLAIIKSNAAASSESGTTKQTMTISVSGDIGTDRVIVCFGQGEGLNKMAHRSVQAPSISIQSEDGEYAIAHVADDNRSLDLLFKNNQPGEFMLNVSIDDAAFTYLHLIDKETGNDINLLQQPSYSFIAKGQEKAQRFMLVFRK